MNRLKHVHIILFVALVLPTMTVAGTESGGGGGVIARGSEWLLIDFLNIDLNFKDDKFSQGEPFVNIMDLAVSTLKPWDEFPYALGTFSISNAISESIRWNFTDEELAAAITYPKDVDRTAKKAVAAYYQAQARNFSVRVNRGLWSKLGLTSQIGLIVHEGLRHLQIAQLRNFDEKSLQLATSILVMCKPQPRLNYYVQYLILNGADLAEKLYGNFETVVQQDCLRKP